MKVKRIVSGIILIIIVALLLIAGNTTAVNIAISTVAIMAVNEYFNCFKEKKNLERIIGIILCIPIAFLNIVSTNFLIIMLPALFVSLFLVIIATNMRHDYSDIAMSGFGIIYIISFIMFIPLLYKTENGKFLIWYMAIAAWGTDTFAYFIGVRFGKHKLTQISPKKSIEGCVAGIIGATLMSLLYTYLLNKTGVMEISYLAIIGISIMLSILGEIGDLAASSIKRYAGIKDFSNLIPGHGGILDRIDSILFIAPFAYFLLLLI